MATASINDAEQRSLLERVVKQYLHSKGWQEGDYALEVPRQQSATTVIVDAIHKDDLQSNCPGGGRSLRLHINLRDMKVTKELAFQ